MKTPLLLALDPWHKPSIDQREGAETNVQETVFDVNVEWAAENAEMMTLACPSFNIPTASFQNRMVSQNDNIGLENPTVGMPAYSVTVNDARAPEILISRKKSFQKDDVELDQLKAS